MLKNGSRKEFRHSPNVISNTSRHSWSLILVFFVFIHYLGLLEVVWVILGVEHVEYTDYCGLSCIPRGR